MFKNLIKEEVQKMKKILFITFLILLFSKVPIIAQCDGCDLTYAEALAFNNSLEMEDMVEIPMRDGVKLYARIYYPKIKRMNLPTVLMRTPYFIPDGDFIWFSRVMAGFLKNGYAVVVNNERGRYWSDGEYTFLTGAKNDGYDVVDWIVNQSWSNGKVGTYGCSSTAEHQLGLATKDHPGHVAMIPAAAGAGIGEVGPYHPQGMFYRGGVIQMVWLEWYFKRGFNEFPRFGVELSKDDKIRLNQYMIRPNLPKVDWEKAYRHLPLMNQVKNIGGLKSDFDEFAKRLPNDPAWHKAEFANDDDYYGVPTLHVNSWYDCSFGPSSMELFDVMNKNATDKESGENQFMIIAPTNHCGQLGATENWYYGDRFMGDASFPYVQLYVDWFDYWLKGKNNGVVNRKKIQLFTMGKNKWEFFDDWPPKESEKQILYLHSTKGANSKMGDGKLNHDKSTKDNYDEFIYDPGNPVPSLGDNDWGYIPEMKSGSFDQSAIEMRDDVLVYSTEILPNDIQITGPVEVFLYLSSNVKDTDLTAKLVDVYPDGKAYNVAESIQRVRWRKGYESPEFMEEDKVYQVKVGPLLTSNQFKQGHRIRLEISSSNFPRFERNLNTGGNNFDETEWEIANNRIHIGKKYASRIEFHVVDE